MNRSLFAPLYQFELLGSFSSFEFDSHSKQLVFPADNFLILARVIIRDVIASGLWVRADFVLNDIHEDVQITLEGITAGNHPRLLFLTFG